MLKRQSLEFDIKWFMEPPSLPSLVTKTWGSNGNCYDKAGVLLFIFRDKCEFLKPLFVFLSSASTHSLLFLDKFSPIFHFFALCRVLCEILLRLARQLFLLRRCCYCVLPGASESLHECRFGKKKNVSTCKSGKHKFLQFHRRHGWPWIPVSTHCHALMIMMISGASSAPQIPIRRMNKRITNQK